VAGPWLSSDPLDEAGPMAPKVDITVAHIARVYDYWLGGKDNFAVDRIAAERVIAAYPDIVRSARGNRAFLGRAVRLVAELPSGSYLALSHPARDIQAAAMARIADRMNELVAEKVTFRTQAEVLRFFDGLELVEPGVVPVPQWRPASDLEAASPTVMWGGVAGKS